MTITTPKLTLAEYLTYSEGGDTLYELVDGELVEMSLGTGEHGEISEFLNEEFKQEIKRLALSWVSKDMKIGVQSPRGSRWETCRIPDLVVLQQEQWLGLKKRESLIRLHEPPPLLVVEVVSPSTTTDDYRAKRIEYAVLDIPEYWIVDPEKQLVTVCQLRDGAYDELVFTAQDVITSPTFPHLDLRGCLRSLAMG
jgi:Uma2 family endonuclease